MANPNDLESAVKQVASEEDGSDDPRWVRLAEGHLSPDEQNALRSENPILFEAYRPIQNDALADAHVLRRAGFPQRPRISGRLAALSGTFAAVLVAAALWLARPGVKPLPPYNLTIQDAPWHVGDAPLVIERSRGTPAEIVLRPTREVSGPIAVTAFVARGGEVRRWSPPIDVRATGVVRISGSAEALADGLPPGQWDVFLVVGRPDDLRENDDALPAAVRAMSTDSNMGLSAHLQDRCFVLRAAIVVQASAGR